jgi:hypothetical protein
VHRCLDRGPQPASRSIRRIGILSNALAYVSEIDWNEYLLLHGMSQPLARCFDPENAIQLYRSIPTARLHEERVPAEPGG